MVDFESESPPRKCPSNLDQAPGYNHNFNYYVERLNVSIGVGDGGFRRRRSLLFIGSHTFLNRNALVSIGMLLSTFQTRSYVMCSSPSFVFSSTMIGWLGAPGDQLINSFIYSHKRTKFHSLAIAYLVWLTGNLEFGNASFIETIPCFTRISSVIGLLKVGDEENMGVMIAADLIPRTLIDRNQLWIISPTTLEPCHLWLGLSKHDTTKFNGLSDSGMHCIAPRFNYRRN